MVEKRKLENDKQMGERNLVGFTLLDDGTERQVRRYNKAQSVPNVNTVAYATLVLHDQGTALVFTQHNLQ